MEQTFAELAKQGPLVLVLSFFLYGFWKKWWVFGYQLEEQKRRGDEWKARALRALGVAETAAYVAEEKEVAKP